MWRTSDDILFRNVYFSKGRSISVKGAIITKYLYLKFVNSLHSVFILHRNFVLYVLITFTLPVILSKLAIFLVLGYPFPNFINAIPVNTIYVWRLCIYLDYIGILGDGVLILEKLVKFPIFECPIADSFITIPWFVHCILNKINCVNLSGVKG
jgi:hypothetical protein